jgi:hypothetical protein
MPIRINLKEIFPSDPQEINVNKLNFNFNKLLELGVGSPGPIGLTGPQGAAGPIGLTGPQGDRGATWWVDSGNPNSLTFTGLIDGDMYLDQDSNSFEIYRYDEGTTTWNLVVSIADVVNTYISSIGSMPFEKITTTQLPGTTSVTKFVLFDTRADSALDQLRGTNNTSTNNILFLSNFDETTTATIGQDQYNSLLAIFPAHNDGNNSSKADIGRYHIEFGSLFTNDDGATSEFSELRHNLKGKFYKRRIDTPELPSTNTWINTAKFSLSGVEPSPIIGIDENGEFEFIVPKWNNEGSPIQNEITIRFSSSDAIVEQGPEFTHIVADGIHISDGVDLKNMTIGLAQNYGSANTKLDGFTHLMLDANAGVDGLIFLNRSAFVNGDMNITDGLTIGQTYQDLTAPTNSLIVEGQIGIGTDSPGILAPGSKVNLHNFLTGNGDLNLVNLNEISSIVFTGTKNLWINTNLLDSITGTPFVDLNRTSISNSQLNSIYLNKIDIDTITATNFYGSEIEFSGPITISGNFYGSRINIPTGAVDFTGSSKEIIGSQLILGENDFTGSSADVYGSKMLLSPNLSASSGSTFRGSHIELLDYIPSSTTEVRGSQITIAPLPPTSSPRPMGDIYGQNININSNMLVANSSELYGVNIQINSGGLNLPNISYGVKVNIGSTLPSGGRAYGLYIDAPNNYIKGGTQIVNDVTESPDSFAIAPGASSGTITETITAVEYDRVLYFTTDPFFGGQRLTAGFLTVTIEINSTQIYYGLAQGSADLEPSITGAANLIQNYSTLIPAGESVSIEFIRDGGFTLAGSGNITYRWHLRKLGRDSSPV